jgi:hypothetical protein
VPREQVVERPQCGFISGFVNRISAHRSAARLSVSCFAITPRPLAIRRAQNWRLAKADILIPRHQTVAFRSTPAGEDYAASLSTQDKIQLFKIGKVFRQLHTVANRDSIRLWAAHGFIERPRRE